MAKGIIETRAASGRENIAAVEKEVKKKRKERKIDGERREQQPFGLCRKPLCVCGGRERISFFSYLANPHAACIESESSVWRNHCCFLFLAFAAFVSFSLDRFDWRGR